MQKILFIILLSLPSYNLFSQVNSSASGQATANLIVPLSIESGVGDLDFGEIILTGLPITETISPPNGKEFIVTGQKGRMVTIMFTDVKLNNSQWLNNKKLVYGELEFKPNMITEEGAIVASGKSILLKPNNLIGEIKLYVGGSINIEATQSVGDYEGLFAISVAY